ncbi:MAG TPA: PHP-associated domain-containing protein, partial [Bryobacteraceae bacterium]
KDVPALAAYLREQRLFFSINHVFSSLTGRRTCQDFRLFEDHFPGVETRNGQIPAANNRSASRLAEDWGKAPVGGSDAHTLECLGSTYTAVTEARSLQDFIAGLRRGSGRVEGSCGDYPKLTRAILEIGAGLVHEHRWAIALLPLMLLVPVATLANYAAELVFDARWSRWLGDERFRIQVADPLLEALDAGD